MRSIKEMFYYTASAKAPGPHLLITAGVHGDEYEPVLAARRLVRQLDEIIIAGKATICPVVNWSAFKINNRCGEDGIDLARICPGDINGSATQQIGAQVSELIRQADYYIDLHTGGKMYSIHPLTGYLLHTSPAILSHQQEMAKAFNLPVIWGTDPSPDGRTLSVARDANVPAIYAEFGGGCTISDNIVDAYARGCMNVLKLLKMVPGELSDAQLEYWVEDHTVNSGYLQGKLPSPADGLFVPGTELGNKVIAGQPIGTIVDMHSDKETEVIANISGIILFLRTDPSVKKGDSLGGILPVSSSEKKIVI